MPLLKEYINAAETSRDVNEINYLFNDGMMKLVSIALS